MKSHWPLRQLLAVLRGVGLILGLLLAAIILQLGPWLVRGGISGVHDHIVRVATAGVAQEHWDTAISRMYGALILLAVLVAVLYCAQHFLAQWVTSKGQRGRSELPLSSSQSKFV